MVSVLLCTHLIFGGGRLKQVRRLGNVRFQRQPGDLRGSAPRQPGEAANVGFVGTRPSLMS